MGFQAFFDDSGTSAPVFVLSGFVSPDYWWEDFSQQWQELLNERPKLQYFKMREAAQLCGQFGGMKAAQRNDRIQKFFRLIQKAAQLSVSSVIPITAFNRIWKGKIDGEKHWNDPYYLGLWDMISFLAEQHFNMRRLEALAPNDRSSPSIYGRLEFVFDDNPRIAATVRPYYEVARAAMHPVFRGWLGESARFEDDKQCLPLQACDVQSWYFRRLFAERFTQEPFKPDMPKSIFSILDEIPSAMSFFSPERMRKVVTKAPAENNPPKRFADIHDLLANGSFDDEHMRKD